MNVVKFGIIGTGMISGMFCEAAAEVPGVEICAVLSRTIERGAAFAGENAPDAGVFTDFDDFARSGINAVYVASPNSLHMSHTVKSLESGLDVLCEKPIASNRKEFDVMTSAAEKSGKILLEAMRPAFDPCYEAVRNNLSRVGKIRRAVFEYCQYSSRYDRFRSGEVMRAFDPSYSNAAVMDIGVYPLSVCVSIFGRPTDTVKSSSVVLRNGMEGSGEVILPYGDMTAVASYSKICDSVNPSVITGEDGSITIDKLSSPKKIAFVGRNGEEEIIFTSARDNNMRYEIAAFADFIREGRADPKYMADTGVTTELIDEIRRQNGILFPADVK